MFGEMNYETIFEDFHSHRFINSVSSSRSQSQPPIGSCLPVFVYFIIGLVLWRRTQTCDSQAIFYSDLPERISHEERKETRRMEIEVFYSKREVSFLLQKTK